MTTDKMEIGYTCANGHRFMNPEYSKRNKTDEAIMTCPECDDSSVPIMEVAVIPYPDVVEIQKKVQVLDELLDERHTDVWCLIYQLLDEDEMGIKRAIRLALKKRLEKK